MTKIDFTSQTGFLNEPYLEWEMVYKDWKGNPYDIKALATFIHKTSGDKNSSSIFLL